MAERVIPGPTSRYIPLVANRGALSQKAYSDVGIQPVNFGPKNTTNTIPGAPAENALVGRRTTAHLGRQFDTMVQNTRALMEHAQSTGNLHTWSQFYPKAHEFAAQLEREHGGLTHLQASGVVASLSGGGGEWEKNQENALRVMRAHQSGTDISHSDLMGVEGSRLENARSILRGANPREVLGDLKERNFMENIHNPEGRQVTVDTHMYHGMTGWKRPWRGSGGGAPGLQDSRVYHFMAGALSDVAHEYGLNPNEGQSTAWYAAKDISGGKFGYVPPHHPRFGEYFDPKVVTPGKRYRSES